MRPPSGDGYDVGLKVAVVMLVIGLGVFVRHVGLTKTVHIVMHAIKGRY
jgi:hypothetical protein